MAPNEVAYALAIADYDAGVYSSIRAAAKAHNVDRTTLTRRIRGTQTSRVAVAQSQQKLSPTLERLTVDWVLYCEACGHPVTQAQLRQFASKVEQQAGGTGLIGSNWVSRFLGRHPDLTSKVGRKIDAARYENTDPKALETWFASLRQQMQSLNIQPGDLYNMDETGLAIGTATDGKVLGSSLTRSAFVKSPEDREWVSCIECISAAGVTLPPVIIFKGKNLQSTWFSTDKSPNWFFTTSENGWTSNRIGLAWLDQVFLPSSSPSRGKWRMLLIDGHGSHATFEFMFKCFSNRVYVFYLLPHTSHVTQPLDLTCFSPLKGVYRRRLLEIAAIDDAAPVKKERFLETYERARAAGLTPSNVLSGFRKAGIVPWSPSSVVRSVRPTAAPIGHIKTPTKDPNGHKRKASSDLWTTPKSSRDLTAIGQKLAAKTPLTRDVRTLFNKVSKSLDAAAFNHALLEAKVLRQEHQLQALQAKKRRIVATDMNSMFADIENVAQAHHQVATREALLQARQPELEAKRTATRMHDADMSRFMHSFDYILYDGTENEDGI